MKKSINLLLMAALLVISFATFIGCRPKDSVMVSTQNLWFGLEAESQTIDVTANCSWTVTQNDTASWYTITPMDGTKDGTITVTVKPLEGADYRGSSFVVTSPGGHIRRTVFISQNKLDFNGMINKVFGVSRLEHWNTDYYGQIIEDSYHLYEFNPYDTTTGYLMYFYENGLGVQRDHYKDTVVYYLFQYDYDVVNQILHIEFETVDDSPESYSPNVLTASDSLYRFMHEYEPDWWERADMRKVGIIHPGEKSLLQRATKKREGGGGIFQF